MKKLLSLLLLPAILMAACSSDDPNDGPGPGPGPGEEDPVVVLEPDKQEIRVGQSVTFIVTADQALVTDKALIYNITTEEYLDGAIFEPEEEGDYQFRAEYEKVNSETRTIKVNPPIYPDVELEADVEQILADGEDKVTFTVIVDEEDVTAQAVITNITDDVELDGASFSTQTIGTYQFRATFEGRDSEIFTVEAISTDPVPSTENTVLLFMAVNDDSFADDDYETIFGQLRGSMTKDMRGNLLIYCDRGNNEPVLVRVYEDLKGQKKVDTLKNYKDSYNGLHTDMLRTALNDAKELFPATNHGLVVRSAGKGWDPLPQAGTEASIVEMAEAIPYTLVYIIFDATDCASLESAYELNGKALEVMSPIRRTENSEFNYETMMVTLLGDAFPNISQVGTDYIDRSIENGAETLYISSVLPGQTPALIPFFEHFIEVGDQLRRFHWRAKDDWDLFANILDIVNSSIPYFLTLGESYSNFLYRWGSNTGWPVLDLPVSYRGTSAENAQSMDYNGLIVGLPDIPNWKYNDQFLTLKWSDVVPYDLEYGY